MIDQIKASYHLDKPFIVQYLLYLKGLLTLDLGQSLRGTESILDVPGAGLSDHHQALPHGPGL